MIHNLHHAPASECGGADPAVCHNESMSVNDPIARERRRHDRRRRPTWASRYFWFGGRRRGARRVTDRRDCYTDVYGAGITAIVILVISTCALDALLTSYLLNHGAVEANPVMAAVLSVGIVEFVVVKLALTGTCLMLLAIHHRLRIYRTFRVRHVMAALAAGYVVLIVYELGLIQVI